MVNPTQSELFQIYGPSKPLHYYDAVECSLNEDADGCCEAISESELGRNPDAAYFWSVHLHFNPEKSEGRGVECVADLPTKDSALAYAAGLNASLRAVLSEGEALSDAPSPKRSAIDGQR